MTKKRRLVTFAEAAHLLGVSCTTVVRWVEVGKLSTVRRKIEVVKEMSMIPVSSLRDAFKVRCLNCGIAFTARRPRKAAYCSTKCRNADSYLRRKAMGKYQRKPARRR